MPVSLLMTPERLDAIMNADMTTYRTRETRVALRAALGSAAGLCDAMAKELEYQNKGRGGHLNKEVVAMSNAFRRCGDEIWRMRDRVRLEPFRDAVSLSKGD